MCFWKEMGLNVIVSKLGVFLCSPARGHGHGKEYSKVSDKSLIPTYFLLFLVWLYVLSYFLLLSYLPLSLSHSLFLSLFIFLWLTER